MKRFRHLMAVVMSLALVITAVPAAFAADQQPSFTDVSSSAWYADAVQYVSGNGLMNGTADHTFSPETDMSRAMLVTTLYRAAGSPAAAAESGFSDVAGSAYYNAAVAWASANHYVNGYGNGTFGPDDPVTRADIASIFYRYAGSPSAETAEAFADQPAIPAYAVSAVNWARSTGVMSGMGNNRFEPQHSATRAQVAQMLRNYLGSNNTPEPQPQPSGHKILVAYFSGTGNTERVAREIAEAAGADTFEITPQDPYTNEDLNYNNSGSRVVREYLNPSERDTPLAQTTPDNWDQYDTVIIGYPIWWGGAAWPVNHFVSDNNFTGKTVIPFCTSFSSGLGQSATDLQSLTRTGSWQTGQRFSQGASAETVQNWVRSLNL